MQDKRPKEAGISLVEVMIALAAGGVIISILATALGQASDMQARMQVFDTMTSLEHKITAAARSQHTLLTLTADENPTFAACANSTGAACAGKWQPLGLKYLKNEKLDGNYDKRGRPCSGKGCSINVQTWFSGACLAPGCQALDAIYVRYEIRLEGQLARSGVTTFSREVTPATDDNLVCGVDAENRPRFATGIKNGKLECSDLPKANAKITGLKAGSCTRGKQVIVGVAADGSIICEDARFTKK